MAETDTRDTQIQTPAESAVLPRLPHGATRQEAIVLSGVRTGTQPPQPSPSQRPLGSETARIPPEVYAAFRRWYVRYLWVQYRKRQRLTQVV